MYWTSSNGTQMMFHSGACDADVAAGRKIPAIKRQLDKIKPEDAKTELKETGGWDDDELQDHDTNLDRILWIAAGDILDRK
jgi:hypothetical protein